MNGGSGWMVAILFRDSMSSGMIFLSMVLSPYRRASMISSVAVFMGLWIRVGQRISGL